MRNLLFVRTISHNILGLLTLQSIVVVQLPSHVNSLWPHGLQHARLPSPSLSPRLCSNSCPLNQWCHPTISSSVIPFFFCLQSFPASGSFQMRQLFASGGQCWSFSFSISPSNIQYWFPLGWTGLISFCPRDSFLFVLSFSISVFIFFKCISRCEIARSYGSSVCGPIDDSHSFGWEVIALCGSDLHFPDD